MRGHQAEEDRELFQALLDLFPADLLGVAVL